VTGLAAVPVEPTAPARLGSPLRREHADREDYRAWLRRHHASPSVRSNRLRAYEAFVDRWPDLPAWFTAPLVDRVDLPRPHRVGGTSHDAMPYLTYLSLVGGVALDYALLLVRPLTSPFTTSVHPGGLGVDHALFHAHRQRLVQLGYQPATARTALSWSLTRLLLHRGDPDLTALTDTDLAGLRDGIEAFAARPDIDFLRAPYSRRPPPVGHAEAFRNLAIRQLHAVHVLLFNAGQTTVAPSHGSAGPAPWTARLVPAAAPPRVAAVLDRYLRLRLEANLDRPETVRHMRDALHRLLRWLAEAHPEITSLDQLTRRHAEEFLCWLAGQTSQHTGRPLATTTRRSVITLLAGFVADTAAWGWDDVPGRVLFTRGDIPKTARSLPRYLTPDELDNLMAAARQLPDPHQRAAVLLARWSGARRDEIRRLTLDCLDAYPDGHPRLRIPVGKGYTERAIPLHPEAADALRPLIELARARNAAARHDPSAGRPVQHVFVHRGKLMSTAFLLEHPLKAACAAAGLIDDRGKPTVTAHRLRHTLGHQLAEGGAQVQTIMAMLGHATPHMSMTYTSVSDPYVKQQYDQALAGAERLAGPAASSVLTRQLEPAAVHWLQTNFFKTELELGHCLRLPAEGPCECDLVLTCSKFLTSSSYAPRLRDRLAVEQQLVDDARTRGWPREVERHQATQRRLEQLLTQLEEPSEPAP
jgi:integrase